jgi:hypothetical protein
MIQHGDRLASIGCGEPQGLKRELNLFDEAGPDRACGEGRTTHRKIVRRSFQEIQLNAHVAGQNPLAAANHDSTSPDAWAPV